MKRLLVLLTLLVGILVFSASAFAQCASCKGALRNVPCPVTTQAAPAACLEFDYDLNAAGDGYCVAWAAPNNYRAILHVCDCLPDPLVFAASLDVGIRMTILVDGVAGDHGAYWSGTAAPAAILWDSAVTQTLACAIPAHGGGLTSDTFGAQTYYLSNGTTVVAALPVNPTCTVAAASRATILEAANIGASVLTGLEGEYWWIDIPPIRIDPALIASGAIVSVRIELLDDTGGGICAGCTICECTIDVATVCCAAAAPTTTLIFPYFTSLLADDPADLEDYWNGIVIINPTATAGTATLTAYDQSGDSWTATLDIPANGLVVRYVSAITWTGTATMGEAVYIQAVTSYAGARGFAMMANGHHDSMGYIVPSN